MKLQDNKIQIILFMIFFAAHAFEKDQTSKNYTLQYINTLIFLNKVVL